MIDFLETWLSLFVFMVLGAMVATFVHIAVRPTMRIATIQDKLVEFEKTVKRAGFFKRAHKNYHDTDIYTCECWTATQYRYQLNRIAYLKNDISTLATL